MRVIAIVFVVALVLAGLPALLGVVPAPAIHDEFAYLLLADTFGHGRLANPPHPLPQFFETLHVLQRPTYAAKFPPGQGLALALGAGLGDPMIGAFGAVAAGCASIAWALRGMPMPWRWALAGGLLAATHPLLLEWGSTRWGGGVALIGGAMALGGALRVRARTGFCVGHAMAGATGAAILAMSRPFEGVIYLTLLGLFVLTGRSGRPWGGVVTRCALPAMLVLGVGLAWLGYYNLRVTGHALLPPDVEYTRQFMAAPRFWWQEPSPDKSFTNEALRAFHRGSEWDEYARQTTLGGFARAQIEKAGELARRWLATPFTTLLLVPPAIWAVWSSRRARWLGLIVLAVPAIEFALTPWFRPHYTAVLGAALFAVLTLGVRRVAAWRPAMAWGLFGVVIAGQAVAAGARLRAMIDQPNVAGLPRQMLIDNLARLPGRDVVFVRYAEGPQTVVEWVYNGASPDEQPILFARDLGDAANRALLDHAPDRSAWRVIVRGVQFEVEPIRNTFQRK